MHFRFAFADLRLHHAVFKSKIENRESKIFSSVGYCAFTNAQSLHLSPITCRL